MPTPYIPSEVKDFFSEHEYFDEVQEFIVNFYSTFAPTISNMDDVRKISDMEEKFDVIIGDLLSAEDEGEDDDGEYITYPRYDYGDATARVFLLQYIFERDLTGIDYATGYRPYSTDGTVVFTGFLTTLKFYSESDRATIIENIRVSFLDLSKFMFDAMEGGRCLLKTTLETIKSWIRNYGFFNEIKEDILNTPWDANNLNSIEEWQQTFGSHSPETINQKSIRICKRYLEFCSYVSKEFYVGISYASEAILGEILNISTVLHGTHYLWDEFVEDTLSESTIKLPLKYCISVGRIIPVYAYFLLIHNRLLTRHTISCSSDNNLISSFNLSHSASTGLENTYLRNISSPLAYTRGDVGVSFGIHPTPRSSRGLIQNYSTRIETIIPTALDIIRQANTVTSKDSDIPISKQGKFIIGIEIECNYKEEEVLNDIHSIFREYMIMKSDGSLDPSTGVELVTIPHTPSFHKKRLLEFLEVTKGKLSAFKDHRCGMHIHVNRGAFTEITLGKFIKFFHDVDNLEFIENISQRKLNNYCSKGGNDITSDKVEEVFKKEQSLTYSKDTAEYTFKSTSLRVNEKYKTNRGLLNLTGERNRGTLEIRSFKSNLSRVSLLAKIEFVEAIYTYVLQCPYNKLKDYDFIAWLDTQKEYNYLKTFMDKRTKLFGEPYNDKLKRTRHKPVFQNTYKNMERQDGTEIDDVGESDIVLPKFKLRGAA